MRLILFASTPQELRPWLRMIRHRRIAWQGGPVWQFSGPGFTGTALLAGMGGARPGRLAKQAVITYPADCLVVAGFGGALTALPPPGGILVADACWRVQENGNLISPVACQQVASARELVDLLQARGLPAYAGTLVTAPKMTAKADLAQLVGRLPQPVLDLETATIAALAAAQSLPLLAVRTITDGAGEEIQDFLARIIDQHQGVPVARLLPALWADPRRVGYCAHLWRRARLAGLNLARALQIILPFISQGRTTATGG